MADVTMPQLGETVTEGTITRWLKAVGDHVARDEILFEVSTDKVDSEVPSPEAGYLAEILVPEGETVDVGVRLAVLTEAPGAGGAAPPTPAAPPTAVPAPAPPAPAAPPAAPPTPAAPPSVGAPAAPAVAAEAPAAAPAPRAAPGPTAAPGPAAPARARAAKSATGARGDGAGAADARLLSPVVRRLMNEHGIDPDQVAGTGPGGRITRADVLALVDSRRAGGAPEGAVQAPARPVAASTALATAPPGRAAAAEPRPARAAGATTISAPVPSGTEEVVPFTNIRRLTAEHMVRSRHTSAHTFTAVEVDFENVERVRRSERERFREEEGVGLTYLPFVIRTVVEALREYPRLNASVGDDALIVHHGLHIGIAVDLDKEGLIVPVIHDADTMRLNGLARAVSELANRARSKKLTADDVTGGTFTITNPGPLGTLFTVPIINQPQVAILSTDGVHRRAVVVTDGDGAESIAIHSVAILGLSYDHRAIDGAYASAFLHRMRDAIQTRDWLQEL